MKQKLSMLMLVVFAASAVLANTQASERFTLKPTSAGTSFELQVTDKLTYSTVWKQGNNVSIIAKCSEGSIADYTIYATTSNPEEGTKAWNYLDEPSTRLPRGITYTLTHATYTNTTLLDSSLTATVTIMPEPALLGLAGVAFLALLTGWRR